MGQHVSIEKPDTRERHPDWDGAQYAGDHDILPRFEAYGGTITWPETYDAQRDGDNLWWRPASFDELAKAPPLRENPGRWNQLVAILRSDPSYWIYISV
jgi:hypothetical protein